MSCKAPDGVETQTINSGPAQDFLVCFLLVLGRWLDCLEHGAQWWVSFESKAFASPHTTLPELLQLATAWCCLGKPKSGPEEPGALVLAPCSGSLKNNGTGTPCLGRRRDDRL